MENGTFYCSFVSNEYIICECGENFPTENELKKHLEKEHGQKTEKKVLVLKHEQDTAQPKVVVCPTVKPVTVVNQEPQVVYLATPLKEVDSTSLKEEAVEYTEYEELQEDYEEDVDSGILIKLEDHMAQHHEEVVDEQVIEEDPGVTVKIESNQDEETEYEIQYVDDIQLNTEYQLIEYVEENEDSQDGVTYQTIVTGRQQLLKEHNYDKEIKDKPVELFCELCGKSFRAESHYRRHRTQQHRIKPPPPKKCVCEVCGKKYNSNAALRYHQRVHTGEKPYECTYCPKKFTMPLFLQIHIRTHTGERPYQCDSCPKAFSNKAAVMRHSRVHTGIKPYSCPECDKAFTQSNSMKLHVRTVHLKQPAPYKSKARRMKQLQRELLSLKTTLEPDVKEEPYDKQSDLGSEYSPPAPSVAQKIGLRNSRVLLKYVVK